MSKYIDADELIKTLNREGVPFNEDVNYFILNAPAADVVKADHRTRRRPSDGYAEIKHGRWIVDTAFGNDVMSDEQMVICSECGKGIFWGKQNYCPNCGSRMDLDGDTE